MRPQVGKIPPLGWKLAEILPTFQPAFGLGHSELWGCGRLADLPTCPPTFQPPAWLTQRDFPRLEVGKIFPSYGGMCPAQDRGTPRPFPVTRISINNQQMEEGPWAD